MLVPSVRVHLPVVTVDAARCRFRCVRALPILTVTNLLLLLLAAAARACSLVNTHLLALPRAPAEGWLRVGLPSALSTRPRLQPWLRARPSLYQSTQVILDLSVFSFVKLLPSPVQSLACAPALQPAQRPACPACIDLSCALPVFLVGAPGAWRCVTDSVCALLPCSLPNTLPYAAASQRVEA